MKINTNNRDIRIKEVTEWMYKTDTNTHSELEILDMYKNYVTYLKKKRCVSKGQLKNVVEGTNLQKRIHADSYERAIGSLALYFHTNNIKCDLGYFYIVSCASFPNYYKIGKSKDAETRLHTYQVCSPFKDYNLVRYVCVNNRHISEDSVKMFLGNRLLNNEWFYSEDIDKDFKDFCVCIAKCTEVENRFSLRRG